MHARRPALALVLACALVACRGGDAAEDVEATAGSASTEATELALGAEAAKAFATVVAEAEEAPNQLSASGRVLDAGALVEVAAALASAASAADASARDLARTRALARDDANASQRELAAAQVADAQAQGALSAARARALASFGTGDGARIARIADALARGTLAVARIELPPDAPSPRHGGALAVVAPAIGDAVHDGRLLGPAGTIDPALQGRAVLAEIEGADLPGGLAVEATVEVGAPVRGVWLPGGAIVWSDGAANAFVATGEGRFARRVVEIARPVRDGSLVASGVAAGERVVVSGAQQLLSALRADGAPEED